MRIAITGATGHIGAKIANQLLDQGDHEVVLLVRNPDKAELFAKRGAKIIEGDLEDPIFLAKGTRNADAVFFMVPPKANAEKFRTYQNLIIRNGVEAVVANKTPHVVLLSSVGGQLKTGTGPIAGLHDAEREFGKAITGLTILRPSSFMENTLMSLDSIAAKGEMYIPLKSDVPMPMIATEDIAIEAVKALTGQAPEAPIVKELTGPQDLSLQETATIIGSAIGKPVTHVPIPAEAARTHLESIGISPDVANGYLEMYAGFESGNIGYEQPAEQRIVTPTTFATFAQDVIAPAMTTATRA